MNDYKYDYLLDSCGESQSYPRDWKPTFTTEYCTPRVKFKVGDSVRLKNGTAEIRLTHIRGTYLSGKYVNSDNIVFDRHQNDFVPYDGESKVTNTNKLYTWKQTLTNVDAASIDLYGHYLAINSQGEWVMEVKGSGQIVAVAKDKVEEVLPYTIGVRFNNNGTTYHYLADKDKFTEGFYLVKDTSSSGWQIARVVDVDTKSPKATVEFAPIGKLTVDLY